MSNIEHLLESAISDIAAEKSFKEWKQRYPNSAVLSLVEATAEEIWMMAQYVLYTYKPLLLEKCRKEAERIYGYPMPELMEGNDD